MFISIQQIKAARALLDWTQEDLAEHAGLNVDQIRRFEAGRSRPLDVLESVHRTLAAQNLDFVDEGVIRKKYEIRTLHGQAGFWSFYDDVYETIRTHGGDILIHNVDESLFLTWMGDKFEAHAARMGALHNFTQKIIIREGDMNFVAKYETTQYRWAAKEEFSPAPFYLYGPKLAMLIFEPKNVSIFVIDQPQITESYKTLFMAAWVRSKIPPGVKA